MERHEVEWADGRFTTTRFIPADGDIGVLLSHGAGSDQDHLLNAGIRDRLADRGIPVMSFDYPYKAEGKGRPDRAEVLMSCHRALIDHAIAHMGRVVVAGRSMGGRIGTMVAVDAPVVGAVAYAYPLHPPGRQDRLRVEHLPEISVPVLMVIGSRDTFVTEELYDEHVRGLPNVTTKVLEGADHGWKVLKRSGRTQDEVFDEAVDTTVDWLGRI